MTTEHPENTPEYLLDGDYYLIDKELENDAIQHVIEYNN